MNSSILDLTQTVQTCQLLLFQLQEDLVRIQKHGNVDYKVKYETLLGERVHLLNEIGQLLLEREQAKRIPTSVISKETRPPKVRCEKYSVLRTVVVFAGCTDKFFNFVFHPSASDIASHRFDFFSVYF